MQTLAEFRPVHHDPVWLAHARARADSLTRQQAVIFDCIGRGLSNAHIAREIGLADRTVKQHVSAVMIRLGVESRLQVGIVAFSVLHCQCGTHHCSTP
ncbi:hypothetical protein Lfu02_73600 [Longispora fulva]|uniref:DNA-binding NarL/FixJ family response regulator n=1 Tax=Longispora fulva TaxID=619741 RepID=A0A8J7GEH0_9ACTN|nr:helix-turn-helix transcriptional regulator [Longispora fulva]MBG6134273.1 DNA-binding NarL/FixJ family response regulator [Longispora fulva]GIG62988.1 hypothetical protein Lfu02_73600 [Longispora fulva]